MGQRQSKKACSCSSTANVNNSNKKAAYSAGPHQHCTTDYNKLQQELAAVKADNRNLGLEVKSAQLEAKEARLDVKQANNSQKSIQAQFCLLRKRTLAGQQKVEQLATKVDALETAVAKLSEERDGLAGQLRDGLKENQLDFEQRILKQLEEVKAQAAANGKQKLIQKVSLPDSNTSMENTPPNVGAPPSKRARHSGNDEEHGEGEGGSHALAVVGQVRVPLQPQQKENLVMCQLRAPAPTKPPANGYLLFLHETRGKPAVWRTLAPEEKQHWSKRAQTAKAQYEQKMAAYTRGNAKQ